jgi:hypothetical protein
MGGNDSIKSKMAAKILQKKIHCQSHFWSQIVISLDLLGCLASKNFNMILVSKLFVCLSGKYYPSI